MDETSQVVGVLDTLVTSTSNPVSVNVSDPARSGLEKIRCALEVRDISGLIAGPHSDGIFSEPPPGLTDPEDLKYFNLYRESFTVEQFHVPKSQRGPGAKPRCGVMRHGAVTALSDWHCSAAGMFLLGMSAHFCVLHVFQVCRGFKGAVRRAINATRFITTTRTAERHAELDSEMDKVLSWDNFNVNKICHLSDRQPLLLVGLMALNHFGLLQTFDIQQETAVSFLRAVEHHYLCALALLLGRDAIMLQVLARVVRLVCLFEQDLLSCACTS